jgi:hypothetical protein
LKASLSSSTLLLKLQIDIIMSFEEWKHKNWKEETEKKLITLRILSNDLDEEETKKSWEELI